MNTPAEVTFVFYLCIRNLKSSYGYGKGKRKQNRPQRGEKVDSDNHRRP